MREETEGKRRLIGGVFGLPLRVPEVVEQGSETWLFQRSDALRLVNARSGFSLLGELLRPRKAWLPSYLCQAVVQGFQAGEVPVEFFPVNDRLFCEAGGWLDRVQPGDLVVRINYFGFLNTDPTFEELLNRGAWIIDDAAQALLTEGIGAAARFVVYSPRKFVGVPEGACLVPMLPAPQKWPALHPIPAAWWLETFSASQLRRDFDLGGGNRDWFSKFQNAEQNALIGPYAMSDFSGHLLDRGFDFSAIALNRRANYRHLLEHLHEFALLHELPDGVVPLGFPIRVENRDAVREQLFRDEVFPPVHWALDGFVPDSFALSHYLARETMTLPCDQRYGEDDMRRLSEAFLRARPITPRGTRCG